MSQTPFAATVPTDPAGPDAADARYAPPQSLVEPTAPAASPGDVQWYAMSPTKLALMSLCTFQIYTLFWFYKQWSMVRDRERSSLMPAMRALFGIVFCWSLFQRVRDSENGAAAGFPAGPMAVVWTLMVLAGYAPEPFMWITFASPLALLPAQRAMNAVNEAEAPGHPSNDRFHWYNWIVLVLGGLFLLAMIVGSLLPDEV